MKRIRIWLTLLLVEIMVLPRSGLIYAEELIGGFVDETISEDASYENESDGIEVLEGVPTIELLDDFSDPGDLEELSDSAGSVEIDEVGAGNTTTITGLFNSSNGGDIRWSKVNGATGYVLYRMRSVDGLKKVVTINNPDTLQYIDDGIKNDCWGRVYTYYVRPVIRGKEGPKSNQVTLQRLAPMKITTTRSEDGQISLSWKCTVSSNKALGYEIQYATSREDLYSRKGSFEKLSIGGRNNLSRTISGLKKGATYYFRIRCYVNYTHSVTGVKTKTWSQYSNVVSVIAANRSESYIKTGTYEYAITNTTSTTVVISKYRNGFITFTATKVGGRGSWIYETSEIIVRVNNNETDTFNWKDSWGNQGTGKIVFGTDHLYLYMNYTRYASFNRGGWDNISPKLVYRG